MNTWDDTDDMRVKRRTRTAILLVMLLALPAVAEQKTTRLRPADGSVSYERVAGVIEAAVNRIVASQKPDGRFGFGGVARRYPIGSTALAVLALEYAGPYLTSHTDAAVRAAVAKGIVAISQGPMENATYSSALVICALQKTGSGRYRPRIDAYASALVKGQFTEGKDAGLWGYGPAGEFPWADRSNTQFAILGLYFAHGVGFPVPRKTWDMARDQYLRSQSPDGGWGYRSGMRAESYVNMTLAGTISLQLCNEMLTPSGHVQCKAPPESKEVNAGLAWLAENLSITSLDGYGLYALERLGKLGGRSELAGHDWYEEGARRLVGLSPSQAWGGPYVADCWTVLFLARGLQPIIMNKLERRGTSDWNNDPHDVRNLVEHISAKFQNEKQWRIVTLAAPVEHLLRVPILFVNGHQALAFSLQDKATLKEYVEQGGTILAEACCGMKEFDQSFRELVKEFWPDQELAPIAKDHVIYNSPVKLSEQPSLLAVTVGEGRLSIIYLPEDQSCRWEVGGPGTRGSLDLGANIYFYVVSVRGRTASEQPERK